MKEELLKLLGEQIRVTVNVGRTFSMTTKGILRYRKEDELFYLDSQGAPIACFSSKNVNLNSDVPRRSFIVSF